MQAKQNFCKAKKLLTIILFIPLFFPAHFAMAAEDKEIEFLLSYVADSGCIFIRNGKEHQSKDASEHLEMKYNHVKNRIKSAEIFIDKIASKSSFSGRPYEAMCDGVKLSTEDWLEEALASYRASTEN
ncbi:MAG: DUF5329 domain-containing protein [Deltaproteobacteria bacterium]|nr:DUF5329 domain-containing protein [Deltaproteobacteria bacterium]